MAVVYDGDPRPRDTIEDEVNATLNLKVTVDAAKQRTALGLGTAATQNTGTSGATVPLCNGANTFNSVQLTSFGIGGTPVGQQAANPDTSGELLAGLEAEINQLKAVMRAFGLIAT